MNAGNWRMDTDIHKQGGLARIVRMRLCLAAAGLFIGWSAGAAEAKKPASQPRHDPPDMAFRRAPMSTAVRTVHVPLSTNLHMAFDTDLLRTHVVWAGKSLNLWGTPYHAAKDRFYCDYEGLTLWTNAPVFPWTYKKPDKVAKTYVDSPPKGRFTGISTEFGVTSLRYELMLDAGHVVPVRETPVRRDGVRGHAIERRIEMGPCPQSTTFMAHAARGRWLPVPKGMAIGLLEVEHGVVLVAARGTCNLKLETQTEDAVYDSIVWTEMKNDSALLHMPVSGREARCHVRIPRTDKPVAVEVLSLFAPTAEEAVAALQTMPSRPIQPPDFSGSPVNLTSAPTNRARVVAAPSGLSVPAGDAHYRIERFPLPREIELQVTGMDFLPNGDLAVCTWLGDVWIVQGATNAPAKATYRLFARGLCEPGGLRVLNGDIHVVQKQELTRLRDKDGDGVADWYECLTQDWGHTGNYHDFSFGPAVDAAGNLYVMRNGNRSHYGVPRMGWVLKISGPDHRVEPFCHGLRSPNCFGSYGPDGDIFMGDNQGNWIGACTLAHMQRGRFYGFPSTYPAPKEDYLGRKDGRFSPPAVWFPYKMAKSVSGMVTVPDDRFGPFAGQIVIGDFQNAVVMRVALEKVNGEWQGVVFPFARGFESGVNRLAFGPDGKLYAGGLKNRAWAAVAPKEWSLERVSFTGNTPFEIHEVHALPDGFELTFTGALDAGAAGSKDNYDLLQYRYDYHEKYGSAEYDHDGKENSATSLTVVSVTPGNDGRSVRLKVDGMKPGFVTMIRCLDVTDAKGRGLRHDTCFYTLNQVPGHRGGAR